MSQEKQLLIDLIQKYHKGLLTDQDTVILENLLTNNEQYAEFFKISTQSSLPSSKVDEAYAKVQQIIEQQTPIKSTKTYTFQVWKYAVAASLLVCGLFGIYYYASLSTDKVVYEVPMGSRDTFVLSDGSSVSLNGGSKLVIDEHFGAENRNVFLEGEGFFDVKHDPKNPFIVTSKNLKIKVLGTAFNVRDYEDDDIMQTTLLRGKVELTYSDIAKQTNYTLLPGDKITFTKNVQPQQNVLSERSLGVTRENIKDEVQLENNVAWKDGTLIFDNEPLPLVISKLNKWFDVSIEIKDSTLYEKRFSGSFENLPLQKILSLIKETGGVKNIDVVNDTIIIE